MNAFCWLLMDAEPLKWCAFVALVGHRCQHCMIMWDTLLKFYQMHNTTFCIQTIHLWQWISKANLDVVTVFSCLAITNKLIFHSLLLCDKIRYLGGWQAFFAYITHCCCWDSISSWSMFQQCLFTSLSWWSYWLMVFWERLSSAKNSWVPKLGSLAAVW